MIAFFFGYLVIISLYVFSVECIIISILSLVLFLSIFKSHYNNYTHFLNDNDDLKGNSINNISSIQKKSGEKYDIFGYSKNSPN